MYSAPNGNPTGWISTIFIVNQQFPIDVVFELSTEVSNSKIILKVKDMSGFGIKRDSAKSNHIKIENSGDTYGQSCRFIPTISGLVFNESCPDINSVVSPTLISNTDERNLV